MKVVIIEDEKPAARRLQRLLKECNIETNTMLHSVKEAIEWFKNNSHPDLILLDIQLSDGLSFEIFEEVDVQSAIIFTTAYDEYALKAFKLNSIDYLLKPIDEEELNHALHQFKINKNKFTINIESIKNLLQNTSNKSYKNRFTIKVGQHLKIIKEDEIECFYSENKASYIHTNSNRNYLTDYSLEQIENLINPSSFFRVNRNYIVSLNHINDIITYTNSRLEIKLNSYHENKIIVSRERVKDFKNWLS
jgi:DNA-binding LytR/AlgR family response regulator